MVGKGEPPWKGPGRLQGCPHEDLRFNKDKCKASHLGKHYPGAQFRLGSTWLESSPVERDLGALVDNKLCMSEDLLLQRGRPTGCWAAPRRHHQQRSRCHCPALLSSTRPHLGHLFRTCCTEKMGQAGEGPEKGHMDGQRSGEPPCEERLRELG